MKQEIDQVRQDWWALGGLAAVLVVLCAATWQKWGTVVVDCGREVYVPTALSQGKRLYFDIWYPYGPLIPYWHALWFRILGAYLWLLEAAGIAIVAITTRLLYSLGRIFLPAALAFAGGFAYLMQAFEPGDEFNYVFPYSYPAAYGVLLLVALTWLLVRDAIAPKSWTFWVAGIIAGLETLIKIEFGVTAYLVLGAAIVAHALRSRSLWTLVKNAAACVPGILLAAGVYGWYIRTGGFEFMFGENISILPTAYFLRSMGKHWAYFTGSIASRGTILEWAMSGLMGLPLLAAAIRTASKSRRNGVMIGAAALALCCFHLALTFAFRSGHLHLRQVLLNVAPVFFFNRGMIVAIGIVLLWTLVEWRRRGLDSQRAALALLLTAGIAMDWRTMFRTQPVGYSIFYDPLVIVGYLVALKKLADLIHVAESHRLWAWTSAVVCVGLVSVTAVFYGGIFTHTFPLSSSRGVIYEDPWTGEAFAQAAAFLNRLRPGPNQLAVWPEEAALYYFTGATAPSRWHCLMPGVLPPGNTTRLFLEELDRNQVKYVALSDRATPEYGVPVFGIDYNRDVYHWLVSHFHVVRTFGDFKRDNPSHWAVQVWEREQPTAIANR